MPTPTTNEPASELQNILVNSNTAVKFLDELSKLAAEAVSETAGDEVECAVTVKVRRRPANAAGSSNRAIELDQMEQKIGDGPCITALRQTAPVSMEDVGSDPRWPELAQRFVVAGVHSSVAIPLNIGAEAAGALNFFASKPYAFTPAIHDKAAAFAAAAENTLNLSVRISVANNRAEDLEKALESRTAINIACGVIMAQNRCSQAQAMEILTKVSSNRNRKLRDVATDLLENLSGSSIQTHFDS
jgi:transcriptional regulator with GAF, ATPase, and Fis domain